MAQNYRSFEIVVVDGHSQDRTAEFARPFAEARFVPQVNKGVADAYNLGIASARRKILALIAHDDVWLRDRLTTQVNYLLRHPDVPYCTGKVRFFLEPGYAIPPGFQKELLQGEHVAHVMETLVVRKPLFGTVG